MLLLKKNLTGYTDCNHILKSLPASLWQREGYCFAFTMRRGGFLKGSFSNYLETIKRKGRPIP
jgi:hypothetical protein